ncbi:M48 family metallopeptidase, partial [Pelomonas sp. KK5]|uniref:tetratricopeptide repeat protein n=1 Tax=Pelomonas sp. KK5 TaxID=1855730 RepID=UPI00117E33D4
MSSSMHPIAGWLRHAVLALGLSLTALAAHADKNADQIRADMQAGRWTQAEQRLEGVIARHPDNALAYYWYAQVLEKQGRKDAAAQALARAETLAPDERFAGNREQLAQLKRRLGVEAAAPAKVEEAAPAVVAAPPAPRQEAPPAEPEHRGSGMTWIFVVAGGLLVVLILVSRRSGGSALKQQRQRWTAEINDTIKDLADAQLVSDANPALSEAQRLSNYDRVRLVKSDLSAALGSLATMSDFSPLLQLTLRARDIAAELRGEERPSDRMRREQQAQLDRDAEIAAGRGQPGYGPGYAQPAGGGSSWLRDAALIGGGAVLGSMIGGASAHGRRDDSWTNSSSNAASGGSLHLPDDDDRWRGGGGVDVGGSDAGFDFGGSDSSSD